MRKYKNLKVTYNGHDFDSLAEKARYVQLRLMESKGLISQLQVHSKDLKYVLIPKSEYKDLSGKIVKLREATYTPDFTYIENGRLIAEDVKGFKTELFNFKAKLFRSRYPEIYLRVVKFNGGAKKGYEFYDE